MKRRTRTETIRAQHALHRILLAVVELEFTLRAIDFLSTQETR